MYQIFVSRNYFRTVLFVLASANAHAIPLKFTAISTPFNSPIGVDYFEPTNSVALSVNYPSGVPLNFETVASDGTHAPFSTISGLTDEIKIATVRSPAKGGFDYGGGGFATGTLFTGNGIDGQIVKINPDTTFVNPFADLPGDGNGLMRGSLYVDRTGVYGGDLMAATTGGEIWRITPAGVPTKLADVNTHLEGLLTVPDDPTVYGRLAGKIIAGAEGQGLLYSFDDTGLVETFSLGVNIEDIDLIPENENFFGVNFGTGRLLGVEAAQWNSVEGQILLTQEFAALYTMQWDFLLDAPKVELVTFAAGSFIPGQWEHVTFAPAGIREIPEVPNPTIPEPATLALLGLGLVAASGARKANRK